MATIMKDCINIDYLFVAGFGLSIFLLCLCVWGYVVYIFLSMLRYFIVIRKEECHSS